MNIISAVQQPTLVQTVPTQMITEEKIDKNSALALFKARSLK